MFDLNPSPPFIVPSPPPPSQKSNLPMLYYGLAVVGTAAIMLAIYNLIIIKWCTQREERSGRGQNRLIEVTAGRSLERSNSNLLLSSFKYKKGKDTGVQDSGSEYECPVCLSVFEDGEEVRQLPRCKHSFHAPCIDMWLYSHSDCPLCRAHVDTPPMFSSRMAAPTAGNTPENSREDLLASGLSV